MESDECPECGRQITVSPTKDVEYGHRRGERGVFERCPRRPACCDPLRDGTRGETA